MSEHFSGLAPADVERLELYRARYRLESYEEWRTADPALVRRVVADLTEIRVRFAAGQVGGARDGEVRHG